MSSQSLSSCEKNIGDDQFRYDMGTREALFNLLILAQKCYDQHRDIFICYIDSEKAFDRIKHDLLMEFLYRLRLDKKDYALLRNFYCNQSVRIGYLNKYTFTGAFDKAALLCYSIYIQN